MSDEYEAWNRMKQNFPTNIQNALNFIPETWAYRDEQYTKIKDITKAVESDLDNFHTQDLIDKAKNLLGMADLLCSALKAEFSPRDGEAGIYFLDEPKDYCEQYDRVVHEKQTYIEQKIKDFNVAYGAVMSA